MSFWNSLKHGSLSLWVPALLSVELKHSRNIAFHFEGKEAFEWQVVQASSPLFFRCVSKTLPLSSWMPPGQLCVCRCLWNLIFLDTCYQFSSRSHWFKYSAHNSIQLMAVPIPVLEGEYAIIKGLLYTQDFLLIYLSQSQNCFLPFGGAKKINTHSPQSASGGMYIPAAFSALLNNY